MKNDHNALIDVKMNQNSDVKIFKRKGYGYSKTLSKYNDLKMLSFKIVCLYYRKCNEIERTHVCVDTSGQSKNLAAESNILCPAPGRKHQAYSGCVRILKLHVLLVLLLTFFDKINFRSLYY